MLTPRLYILRATRTLRRGGFTLVELLVVIGIIAILAGVALGPITSGIKKAKQSSALQSSHALGLAMYSAANDNSQVYPDTSATGAKAADSIAANLLSGGYVPQASIFYISSDSAATPPSATNTTSTGIVGSGVTCWDFLGNTGKGVSTTNYTYLPILWTHNTGAATPAPSFSATFGTQITCVPAAGSGPFSSDGMAFFYINNSAAFVTSTVSNGGFLVIMVTGSNNQADASVATNTANYATVQGS